MQSCGIVSQLTPPYTPQHNGVSERRNRALHEMVRSMMNSTTLPKSFWGYALESDACILNMVPTKKVTQRKRWDTTSTTHKKTRFVARYAEFFEHSLTLEEASGSHILLKASGSYVGLELIQEDDTQPSNDTSKQYDKYEPNEVETHSVKVPIHRSERISQTPDRYGFYVDAEEHELGDLNEPPNYKALLSYLESNKFLML
nr:retrotransposon protein, putative, Ty1-copia subclass [Tanacetum cinerariifolium]